MKKIVALVLALMLALSMLTVATAETANPVAGKKVAYIMLLPSATIFQMWRGFLRRPVRRAGCGIRLLLLRR